ncbi:MAG TPA: hypothetical protein VMO17_07960 [Terriglobia bacterium]|nr:hypothetical protein [Terriglobia bacterium]
MNIEQTVEFILSAQANLGASAQKHDEQISRLESSVARLESSVATVTDLVGRVAQAQIRLLENTQAAFREVREIQANTEYKLNALIETVDKLIRHNGNRQ